jgi:hypothetical protein
VRDLICDEVLKEYLDRLYLMVNSSIDGDAREKGMQSCYSSASESEQYSRRAPLARRKAIRMPPGRGVLPHAWSWISCVTCQSAGSFFVAHRLFGCGVTIG